MEVLESVYRESGWMEGHYIDNHKNMNVMIAASILSSVKSYRRIVRQDFRYVHIVDKGT